MGSVHSTFTATAPPGADTGGPGAVPLVSCLMVTSGRVRLARRAVRCFQDQTWPSRELVIVDDGRDDYAPMLRDLGTTDAVRYERVQARPGTLLLGGLRNIALDLARGQYCMQWDDDEWYHPQRIDTQMAALQNGAGGCVLRDTLMHLDTPAFMERPYRTGLRSGTPGTILHRRTHLRYPNVRRGEDSAFRDALRRKMRIVMIGPQGSHLFIRCFHGANTWERRHFEERLHYTLADKIEYARARYLRGDLFTHRAFQLTPEERASVGEFLAQSRAMGILPVRLKPDAISDTGPHVYDGSFQ